MHVKDSFEDHIRSEKSEGNTKVILREVKLEIELPC